MKQPAAKQNDLIQSTDTHLVVVGGLAPVPTPHPFLAPITQQCSPNVKIMGMPAATVGSSGTNTPVHIPIPPAGTFTNPPSNQGRIFQGSSTVRINSMPAARNQDVCMTCNDIGPIPGELPNGKVVASGTVLIGGSPA